MAQEVNDLGPVQDILREYAKDRGALIPVLQKVQAVYRWLPKTVLEAIAEGGTSSVNVMAPRATSGVLLGSWIACTKTWESRLVRRPLTIESRMRSSIA